MAKQLTKDELIEIICQERKVFLFGRAATLVQYFTEDDLYPVSASDIDTLIEQTKRVKHIGKKTRNYLKSVLERELC